MLGDGKRIKDFRKKKKMVSLVFFMTFCNYTVISNSEKFTHPNAYPQFFEYLIEIENKFLNALDY